MNQFVESLCRLYKDNRIDDQKLNELLIHKKITQQEYDLIISVKNDK